MSDPRYKERRLALLREAFGVSDRKSNELFDALNAMLTYFAMDEDEWSKPVFDKARLAIANHRKESK